MRAYLELLSRLLINVRTSQNRVPLDSSRQRDWPMHNRTRPLRGVHNFGGRLIQHGMIISFHPYPNSILFIGAHSKLPVHTRWCKSGFNLSCRRSTPATGRPTTKGIVQPPLTIDAANNVCVATMRRGIGDTIVVSEHCQRRD